VKQSYAQIQYPAPWGELGKNKLSHAPQPSAGYLTGEAKGYSLN